MVLRIAERVSFSRSEESAVYKSKSEDPKVLGLPDAS